MTTTTVTKTSAGRDDYCNYCGYPFDGYETVYQDGCEDVYCCTTCVAMRVALECKGPCPACGSEWLLLMGRLGQRAQYRCKACGLDSSGPLTTVKVEGR